MKMTVKEYIVADRQWLKRHRIARAKTELAKAPPAERQFWRAVLEANLDSMEGL